MAAALIVTNARVWTGWSPRPRASALEIEDGRITKLDPEVRRGCRVVDADGGGIVPGLVDAHLHLTEGAHGLSRLDLSEITSRAAFIDAIARRHASLPADRWLLARGWSEERWGGGLPDKSWLAPAGERPVVCDRMDLHAVLVNDAVLQRLDLAAAPRETGRVERDPETGAATGVLVEAAAWSLVNPLVPVPAAEESRAAVLAAQAHLHRLGVTAVGTMEYAGTVRSVYEALRERLTLRCRVTLLDRGWPMSFDEGVAFPTCEMLAVVGYKAFLDGTLGSRTARLLEDYADDPGNRGVWLELAASGDVAAWAAAVARHGLSPSMHAIGDAAVRLALDVTGGLPAGGPRPRIEHAQLVHPDDLPRFRGVIASMQPLHKADDGCYAEARLGVSRLDRCFPFRRLAAHGAILAFGSDWPVVSCDPLAGMRAAITGLTREGRPFRTEDGVDPEAALRAYTAGAAAALGLDGGVLRPGAPADLVVLDRDPLACDWCAAPPVVRATMVAGAVVHDDSAAFAEA